jgi:ATP-dependent DNA helicase RecG
VVVNLLIHREYTNAHPATLIVFGDRVETKNANKPHLYGPLHPGSFDPFSKNPSIAKMFVQMGVAEELGTGIRKVFRYAKAYSGSDKVEFREEDLFVVNVPTPPTATEETPSHSEGGGTSGGINALRNYIETSPGKRTNEIAQSLSIPAKTIEKHLAKLVKSGKIQFRGSKKTGGYYVA